MWHHDYPKVYKVVDLLNQPVDCIEFWAKNKNQNMQIVGRKARDLYKNRWCVTEKNTHNRGFNLQHLLFNNNNE
jgi:hypothetical protein